MRTIHLLSGGLDSTVLLYDLLSQGDKVRCILFNYGQRNLAELRYARATCKKLGVQFDDVELCRIQNIFLRCALTDGVGSSNIVPNRNGVFLNISAAICESLGFDQISFAANADDDDGYPDARGIYLHALNTAFRLGEIKARIIFPYESLTKAQIVAIGRRLGVQFEETMSCYEGTNCGKCDACRLRKKALK